MHIKMPEIICFMKMDRLRVIHLPSSIIELGRIVHTAYPTIVIFNSHSLLLYTRSAGHSAKPRMQMKTGNVPITFFLSMDAKSSQNGIR